MRGRAAGRLHQGTAWHGCPGAALQWALPCWPQGHGGSGDSRGLPRLGGPAGCSEPCSCVPHQLMLSSASQGLVPPELDPQGLGWASGLCGQSRQEIPCPDPWRLQPACLGARCQRLDPHWDTESVPMSPTAAASPRWGRVFPAKEVPVAHHPTGASKPTHRQPPSRALRHQGQCLPRSSSVPGDAPAGATGHRGAPSLLPAAPQGAADSGSCLAQHKPRHGMVFSCFSQSADACGNGSGEGESKQG